MEVKWEPCLYTEALLSLSFIPNMKIKAFSSSWRDQGVRQGRLCPLRTPDLHGKMKYGEEGPAASMIHAVDEESVD